MGLCFLVIGVSVLSNLVAFFVYPENKRLRETETMLFVLFDMLQLGLMLHLTGGLNNPFSILIVGPVTVAASALSTRSTVFLGLAAIAIVSLLMDFHLPLRTEQGFIMRVPDIFRFGNWVAIVIAVIFLGVYSRWIVSEMHAMSDALEATQMALAREQKLTDLGGVVAAAAHEMGTPLATIKLTSSELADELDDAPELREDALLIREQADRCRDILRSMGRAGKDDLHLRKAPLISVVEEAAEPHLDRGKSVHFELGEEKTRILMLSADHSAASPRSFTGCGIWYRMPLISRRRVSGSKASWSRRARSPCAFIDDGKGYPHATAGPHWRAVYQKTFAVSGRQRPGYDGMGLGLFIAKTLLATFRCRNELSPTGRNCDDSDKGDGFAARIGAVVELTWPRHLIDAFSEHQPHCRKARTQPFTRLI